MTPHEAKMEVECLLAECKRDGGKLVSSISAILQLLQTHQLAWKQRIHASQVGVHPHNREGVGVSVSETHALIDDVLQVGFSTEEAGKSFALRFRRQGQYDSVAQRGPERQCNGKLATLQPRRGKYANVAGSHLNAGLT